MITQNKIRGLFLGIAVGDALGSPFESKTYESIKDYPRASGYVNSSRGQGIFTDDSQLTLATANAIIEAGKIDMDVIAVHHVKAYKETVSGWGSTTRNAVKKISEGVHWSKAGDFAGQENRGFGNGVPMKLAPLAAYFALTQNFDDFDKILFDFTSMTHQTSVAVSSCFAHTTALYECLLTDRRDFNAKRMIKRVIRASELGRSYYSNTLQDDLTERLKTLLPMYDIPDLLYSNEYLISAYDAGTCYVYNSLPFSYAFFLRGPFSLKSLIDAAYAGGDADTNASIVGGMLGALNGTEIFSEALINGLMEKEKILKVADDFYEKFSVGKRILL